MGRAPCCEKMGLKKGPWTREEDQLLINYINLNGHTNWRALPKQAGLLRCGKSCRLRWINYLRPDIKRGNFTQEEEDAIINLHQMLGNRWSTIAAKLPGRTDNEIKNVWHTHLKKRLPKENELETGSTTATSADVTVEPTKKRARRSKSMKKDGVSEGPPRKHVKCMDELEKSSHNDSSNNSNGIKNEDSARPTSSIKCDPVSPQPCTSEVSTITSTSASARENDNCSKENVVKKEGYIGEFPEFNDDFWMEVLFVEDTAMSTEDLPCISQYYMSNSPVKEPVCLQDSKVHSDDMDFFWYNLLTRPDNHLPEFSEML